MTHTVHASNPPAADRSPAATSASTTQRESSLGRVALLANGAFSFATGLLLAIAAPTVGDWLGVSIDPWLRALGIALIGHGALLSWAARLDPIKPWVRLNLMTIAPYPLLMIGLVIFGLVDRTTGQILVLLDGVIVGLLAVGHWLGLRNG